MKIRFRGVTAKRAAAFAGMMAAAAALAWELFIGLPRWYGRPKAAAGPAAAAESAPGRKIKANLYYVSDDGAKLTSVEREVPYAEGTVEQAKAIVTAQIASVAEPLVSAIPQGTMLRALFVTPQGQAYLDLSGELAKAHPGGSLNELLTIYTLVDALTTNLPAVTAVQVLIDGKQVDTLAGHIDLRRPLAKNLEVVQQPDGHQ
jgi:spore germination protein GerM